MILRRREPSLGAASGLPRSCCTCGYRPTSPACRTAALALGLAWGGGADAADLQWSPNGVTPGGGGTGAWNATIPPPWFNGATFQIWSNAALDNAIFGGSRRHGDPGRRDHRA